MQAPTFPSDWGVVSATHLTETATSRIWEVVLQSGFLAIVKDLKPAGFADERAGILFLQWRQGYGAADLLGQDDTRVLLEHVGGQSLLDHLDAYGDEQATAIAADVLMRLHGPANDAAPDGLYPLLERFSSLFAKAQTDLRNNGSSLFIEAAGIAEELLCSQQTIRPLHGDIHHENILHGPRGWLAIDPKGLIGDPVYDAANLFCNPVERPALRTRPERVARLARILSDALGYDEGRLLRYGFAHACLSASWHIEDGNFDEAEDSLAVARTIRSVIAGR